MPGRLLFGLMIGAAVVDAVGGARPAVVGAGLEEVELVAAARPVLDLPHPAGLGMHREALRIAMAPGEDLRPRTGPADEGIVRRHRAVVPQAHDLAAEVAEILRARLVVALARRDIHQPRAVEGDARAEMQAARGARQGLEDRRDVAQAAVAQFGARHRRRGAALRLRPSRRDRARGSARSRDAGRHRAGRPGRVAQPPWARPAAACAPAGRWRRPAAGPAVR